MNKEEGCAVQVVSVEDAGRYAVCTEALRGVAARAELRGLPVAVVSVAGSTRGGKSFLLDFMLRYLRATPSARSDGTWLGAEDEPLSGFSWCGGCERDTTGILLWSEPIVLTRESGQKVVVLLMDTQGTFDSSSTIRDSTTIFAMSTLLSSVQIYNLSMNILEDNLQYLQLFTEYGKLAAADIDKPFQVLQFLVRDWCYAYQHPLGAVGGQQLLDKRLQINDNQAEELKEIRLHIQSCFERVECFLMPHPGLTVATSPNFKGCLSDISTEFKNALLELVRGLFEDNFTLKKINGQEIQVQELVNYFESYMEIFNSDQLPTPVTILKATSSACLEAALSSARELYVTHMERASESCSVPRDVMPRLHADASRAARQAIVARRTLAAPHTLTERLDKLMLELDNLLPNYVALNEAKIERSITASKAVYKKHMEVNECLLLAELEEMHQCAVEMALELFDGSMVPLEDNASYKDTDNEDRKALQQELEEIPELYQFEQKNEAKIKQAITAAMQTFEEGICQDHALSSLCVHSSHLMSLNRTAKDKAVELFDSRWRSLESAQNENRTALLTKLYERFLEIQSINVTNNENAVEKALKFYDDKMLQILGTLCLHPMDLQKEHKALYDNTIVEFHHSRTYGNVSYGRDNYLLKLIRKLPSHFTKFQNINENKNQDAVKTAHAFYEYSMQILRGLNPDSSVLFEFMGPPDFEVVERHAIVKPRAINKFKEELRKIGPRYPEDKHLDELTKMIDSSYNWLLVKLGGNVVMNLATVASLAIPFLRR